MTHSGHFGFHVNLVFRGLNNFMWLLDHEVADDPASLVGNLNFRKHAIADRAKYPNLITSFYEIVITFTHQVAIYGIEQKVVKDHKRIERHATILKHKDRDEHAVVEQVFRHGRIDEGFVFLNIKSWMGKILFHDIYDISLSARNETCGRYKGFEPNLQIRKLDLNKKGYQVR